MYISHHKNIINYPELKINESLVSMLDKSYLGKEYIKKRGKNHARQFYTLYNSWPIIKRFDPDLLIRIRDDGILKEPLKLPNLIQNKKYKKMIITPRENSWAGMNDKFAIVTKDAIEAYLTEPFQVYNEKKKFEKWIKNPEQFLKYVYDQHMKLFVDSNIRINIFGQKWATVTLRQNEERYLKFLQYISQTKNVPIATLLYPHKRFYK